MDAEAVTTLFALLAVVLQVAIVVVVASLTVLRSTSIGVAVRTLIDRDGLLLAWLIALVCTLGSLYLSEVAHFPPCRLCWFQRIAMYPLSVVLAVGVIRHELIVRWYAFPLASIGAAISAWHMLVERYPSLEGDSCDPTNPCSLIWVEKFGYLTIPTMALTGFIGIIVILATMRPRKESEDGDPTHQA